MPGGGIEVRWENVECKRSTCTGHGPGPCSVSERITHQEVWKEKRPAVLRHGERAISDESLRTNGFTIADTIRHDTVIWAQGHIISAR